MKIADILQRLERIRSVEPLAGARYATCLATYEAASTQRSRIVDWFAESIAPGLPTDRSRLLSVGCGAGDLDVELLGNAADHAKALRYVGLEPDPSQCRRFLSRLESAALDGVEIEAHNVSFEAFDEPRRFDLVMLVHSLYYMDRPQRALEQALGLLEDDGRLVVLIAANDLLNELPSAFWKLTNGGRPSWFSEDLQAYLEESDIAFERSRIEATLDLSECCEPRTARGIEIADFLAQISTADLSPGLRRMVFAYLEETALDDGTRRWLPHNVDAFVIERPAQRAA